MTLELELERALASSGSVPVRMHVRMDDIGDIRGINDHMIRMRITIRAHVRARAAKYRKRRGVRARSHLRMRMRARAHSYA